MARPGLGSRHDSPKATKACLDLESPALAVECLARVRKVRCEPAHRPNAIPQDWVPGRMVGKQTEHLEQLGVSRVTKLSRTCSLGRLQREPPIVRFPRWSRAKQEFRSRERSQVCPLSCLCLKTVFQDSDGSKPKACSCRAKPVVVLRLFLEPKGCHPMSRDSVASPSRPGQPIGYPVLPKVSHPGSNRSTPKRCLGRSRQPLTSRVIGSRTLQQMRPAKRLLPTVPAVFDLSRTL